MKKSMWKQTRMFGLAAAILLGSFIPVPAALIDQGITTFDTESGLTWLDLTESTNRSFGDVTDGLDVGGDFFGYRFATNSEVLTLYENAGVAFGTGFRGVNLAYNNFIDLFGPTASSSSNSAIQGVSATGVDLFRAGVFSNVFQTGYWADILAWPITSVSPSTGFWLVEGTPPPPIPLPAAVWLFLSALGGLGLFGWRRRRESLSY